MLRFCDSFDHYDTVAIPLKWELQDSIGNMAIGAFGRNGTSGLRLVAQGASSGRVGKSFVGGSLATWIAGCAFTPETTVGAAGSGRLIDFIDSIPGLTSQVYVQWDATVARLRVFRGDGTLLATSSVVMLQGVYYYVEFKATIGNAGSFDLHVNGAADVSGAGVDTQVTANASADIVKFGMSVGANTRMGDIDDLYIADTTTAVNNDFLGDVRVQAIRPDGAGGNTAWTTLVGAATHWEATDETPPDEDVTYVASATAGQIDTFTLMGLTPTTGTIKGIQTSLWARKDDAGVRTIRPQLRIAAVNYLVGVNHNVGDGYGPFFDVVELSPATAAAFTIAEINGMEAGANLIA